MFKIIMLFSLCSFFFISLSLANEIKFIEEFSLSYDRDKVLQSLIPGTDDYYYYHCLHTLNKKDFEKTEVLLKSWKNKLSGDTGRIKIIENRKNLLEYDENPQKALDYLKKELNLHFNHTKAVKDRDITRPSKLDQKLISREVLFNKTHQNSNSSAGGYEESSFGWLLREKISKEMKRNILKRLNHPDFENLPRIIVDDLNHPYADSFGSYNIHKMLTLDQLNECETLKPELLNDENFVFTYITRLWPDDDTDITYDSTEKYAYIDNVWSFVSRLNPSFNSLKVHTLYHLLDVSRITGNYNHDAFLSYLKLPRHTPHVNAKYIRKMRKEASVADLNHPFKTHTLLGKVGSDNELVRGYLTHFMLESNTYEPYSLYLDETFLKKLFAETMILNERGDSEKWYSIIGPVRYKEIQDLVKIDFLKTNKECFSRDEDVSLELIVKNVTSLIVKIYEINTTGYYRDHYKEINTGIDLDGLVANSEFTYDYEENPFKEVKRTFKFPSMKKTGVYVAEFIGNGKSSRALIRKGQLRHVERVSVAGHVFTLFDENNSVLENAVIIMGGREYSSDSSGRITIPFSTNPGRQKIILLHDDFASLSQFDHQDELYSFSGGIYIDREQLVKYKKADIVIRPSLRIHNIPVPLNFIDNTVLEITSTDADGVTTSKKVTDFKLHDNQDSIYELKVPDRLTSLFVELKSVVKTSTPDKDQNLSISRRFNLNNINTTERLTELYLTQLEGEYFLDLLGRTGEVYPYQTITLQLKHKDFIRPVYASLMSDKKGRINLGLLDDIEWIQGVNHEKTERTWYLQKDIRSYPEKISSRSGDDIIIPFMETGPKESLIRNLSFMELRKKNYFRNCIEYLKVNAGEIIISGLLPGDYELLLKSTGKRVYISVTEENKPLQNLDQKDYYTGRNRFLEKEQSTPLQISKITENKSNIEIALSNITDYSRVHVIATRFIPSWSLFNSMQIPKDSIKTLKLGKHKSIYVSGREIGEEYRYIIDRKYADKYPGNMLERPQILLNPWEVQKTETDQRFTAGGDVWADSMEEQAPHRSAKKAGASGGFSENIATDNFDFLSQNAVTFFNLKPDQNGIIKIDKERLTDKVQIHILAIDPANTVYRSFNMKHKIPLNPGINDNRLLSGLDPDSHFMEKKQVTKLQKNSSFSIKDIRSSEFVFYDSLEKIYQFFLSMNRDPNLKEFSFILQWSDLTTDEKKEKYSRYSCHELNFFLSKKDPEFFKKIVVPYLFNKNEKTFMDHWLLSGYLDKYDKTKLLPYLDLWNYNRLNIVEKILLGKIMKDADMPNHIKDLYDLLPPDIEQDNFLFNSALKSRSLDATDDYDVSGALQALPSEAKSVSAEFGAADEMEEMPILSESVAKPSIMKKVLKSSAGKRQLKKGQPPAYFKDAKQDIKRKSKGKPLYRKMEHTKEYAENNYYHLPQNLQNENLISVNNFWKSYALKSSDVPFNSGDFIYSTGNFTEMMFALAVLDLPIKSEEHAFKYDDATLNINTSTSGIVFHKNIDKAETIDLDASILVSQNFFQLNDRYTYKDNKQIEKYIRKEFLPKTVYGCQVTVTNPSSFNRQTDILLQIPQGAIPVLNSRYTHGFYTDIAAFSTSKYEYFFYFPVPGDYSHYPVHVAENKKIVSFAEPLKLNVVQKLSTIDRASWDYISQNADDDDVINYLNTNNLKRLNLNIMAWRLHEKDFFRKIITLLSSRHVYNKTFFSYGVRHNDTQVMTEFLKHEPDFVAACGEYLDSSLLKIDPVQRDIYEHLEYRPLVNPRVHRLGKNYEIQNNRFFEQYHKLLKILGFKDNLNSRDLLAVTYYMLLQDRFSDADRLFNDIKPSDIEAHMQYDYLNAYMSYIHKDFNNSRAMVDKYLDYPVPRWQKRFTALKLNLDEVYEASLQGKPGSDTPVTQADSQTELAAGEASFDFNIKNNKIHLNYQNINKVTVNYYLMDLELLFSRTPFVKEFSGQFSSIKPNLKEIIKTDPEKMTTIIQIPEKFDSSNILVEIVSMGVSKTNTLYSNSLNTQIIENYGQIHMTHDEEGIPLPGIYIKVYAKYRDGSVLFYKDGYTDPRGRFDYIALNTDELDQVNSFSILILSEKYGAVVKTAQPPKR